MVKIIWTVDDNSLIFKVMDIEPGALHLPGTAHSPDFQKQKQKKALGGCMPLIIWSQRHL